MAPTNLILLIVSLVQVASQMAASNDADIWRRRSIKYHEQDDAWPGKSLNKTLNATPFNTTPGRVLKRDSVASANGLAYMISPISEQLIPLGSYPGQNRRREGELVLSPAKGGFLLPSFNRAVQQNKDQSTGSISGIAGSSSSMDENQADTFAFNKCRSLQTSVQVERDLLDPINGRKLRTCRGLVTVNRCDGFCSSAVRPSAKLAADSRALESSLYKECHCCSESSLRSKLVRLEECYDSAGVAETTPGSYLEVTLEEPLDCQCRECKSISDLDKTDDNN